MTPIAGTPILTATEMRAVEAAHGDPAGLMDRAGAGVADAVRRVAAGADVLVLCGPGNTGGVGYVAARVLREQGLAVRVAALTPPRNTASRQAAAGWGDTVADYTRGDETARHGQKLWNRRRPEAAPVMVDALFGTGSRDLSLTEPWVKDHRYLFDEAQYIVAVDLPLGLTAAARQWPWQDFLHADLTLALGALKPAHVLADTRATCGDVRLIDLGLDLPKAVRAIARPADHTPDANTHKYTRGMVGVVAGAMPGAARLAATAAARAGAGYVALYGDASGGPDAIVHRPLTKEALADVRIDCVIVGPGLGRDDDARRWLEWLIRETHHRLVIDGDALHLLDPAWLAHRESVVLTPHAGEHAILTAKLPWTLKSKADPFGTSMRQIKALATGGHVMVAKGATTVISNHAETIVAPGGNPWLSTAGTGDVLAGAIGAMVAATRHGSSTVLDAAAAGVWHHAEAARLCGRSFIADDLAAALSRVR